MQKNWNLFEGAFTTVGLKGGKEKILAFMDRLNEIRRFVGHPTKMHASGWEPTAEDTEFLGYVASLMLRLANRKLE